MRDWLLASLTVKSYYLFLLVVVLWTIMRVTLLARILFAPFSRRRPFAQLVDLATPIDVAARVVLSGKTEGIPTIQACSSLERIGLRVDYLASKCAAAVCFFGAVSSLTLLVSLASVVADAIPAFDGELFAKSALAKSQALYLAADRLTTRLSIGLLVAASLTLCSAFFEQILRRRCAEWKFVLNSCRAQQSANSETPFTPSP